MPHSPWSTPKHKSTYGLSEAELAQLQTIATAVRPAVRVGYKDGLSQTVIAKTNAHLHDSQIVKIEFVGSQPKSARQMAEELAHLTLSECISFRGTEVVLFRKNPNQSLADFLGKYRSH